VKEQNKFLVQLLLSYMTRITNTKHADRQHKLHRVVLACSADHNTMPMRLRHSSRISKSISKFEISNTPQA
jgi:hypothetical protein